MTTKSLRTEPQKRLYSLDVLRGFDMFWITGGGALAIAISQLTGAGWLKNQMHHILISVVYVSEGILCSLSVTGIKLMGIIEGNKKYSCGCKPLFLTIFTENRLQ